MNPLHLVRATDPLSSILAAEQVPNFAEHQHRQILAALEFLCAGPQLGATAREIAEHSGLTMEQVARRMPDLKAAGKAAVLQYEGGDLMRGRCRVWALAKAAL
ncbi:hypothetical protein [Pseudorhodoferax sp. Leaf265]|uniref:hypothetical protein n=1 Tax=Pseudorhodoferax sp. Leaf265 TaxID=1736315 RepID=UPI000701D848|nr:hypothetical protein [Pseudorhodoferax sp. Leaf265]KQP02480.1 hypothetical protein ASF45_20720 [Pseudorhodoferax sp. Leaf265]